MHKFIFRPLHFQLNGESQYKAHVADAKRLKGAQVAIKRLPTQRRSALALEAILVAGVTLFERTGTLKINELCDYAGVSIGTFYTYFRDAEHFLNFLHLFNILDSESELIFLAKAPFSLPEKILTGTRLIHESYAQHRQLRRFFREAYERGQDSTFRMEHIGWNVHSSNTGLVLPRTHLFELISSVRKWVDSDSLHSQGVHSLLAMVHTNFVSPMLVDSAYPSHQLHAKKQLQTLRF